MWEQYWLYCSLDFNENSSPLPLTYLLYFCLSPPPLSLTLISGLRWSYSLLSAKASVSYKLGFCALACTSAYTITESKHGENMQERVRKKYQGIKPDMCVAWQYAIWKPVWSRQVWRKAMNNTDLNLDLHQCASTSYIVFPLYFVHSVHACLSECALALKHTFPPQCSEVFP